MFGEDALFEVPTSTAAKPSMLTLVREAAGMTQAEVAANMTKLSGDGSGPPVGQGYVSRAEKGRLIVAGDRLKLYAQALSCTPQLLCLDVHAAEVGIGLVYHRKKAALSAPALRRIHGQLALARLHVRRLRQAAGDTPHEAAFVRVDLDEETRPYEAATQVREAWGLPPGPVDDLIARIERSGGMVLLRDLGSDHLDAVSQWPAGCGPLLLVNTRAPADRLRFSIAHELGHLTMHRVPDTSADQEKQADEFAAAFLMPADDITPEFEGNIDLALLLRLKARWRVSMGALLRRARDLHKVTEWHHRTLTIEMSTLGYRTAEPGAFAPEQPTAVREAIRRATQCGGLSLDELAQHMYLSLEDLKRDYAADLA